jgi:hypothetical protein
MERDAALRSSWLPPAAPQRSLFHCFRFRNHLPEQQLVVPETSWSIAPNFELAKCRLVGIVSVSRSVQNVFSRPRTTEATLQTPDDEPGSLESRIGQMVCSFTPFF